jgi:PHP family Zn ribbon phosphoesterase
MYNRFRLDAHVHSQYSGDAFLRGCTPQKILNRAISAGLDGIVITDARADIFFDKVCQNPKEIIPNLDLISYNGEIALLKKDSRTLYLLRGMEHHDDKGHLLDIGGMKPIKYNANYSLTDRINEAHDNGRIIGPAHPFDIAFGGFKRQDLEEITDKIDFVEIFNPLTKPEFNQQAKEFSERHDLPGISNSDDHNCKPGIVYTLMDITFSEDLDEFAQNIKDSIVLDKINGQHIQYVPFSEKLRVFMIKEFLAGDFSAVADRTRRYFNRK